MGVYEPGRGIYRPITVGLQKTGRVGRMEEVSVMTAGPLRIPPGVAALIRRDSCRKRERSGAQSCCVGQPDILGERLTARAPLHLAPLHLHLAVSAVLGARALQMNKCALFYKKLQTKRMSVCIYTYLYTFCL